MHPDPLKALVPARSPPPARQRWVGECWRTLFARSRRAVYVNDLMDTDVCVGFFAPEAVNFNEDCREGVDSAPTAVNRE